MHYRYSTYQSKGSLSSQGFDDAPATPELVMTRKNSLQVPSKATAGIMGTASSQPYTLSPLHTPTGLPARSPRYSLTPKNLSPRRSLERSRLSVRSEPRLADPSSSREGESAHIIGRSHHAANETSTDSHHDRHHPVQFVDRGTEESRKSSSTSTLTYSDLKPASNINSNTIVGSTMDGKRGSRSPASSVISSGSGGLPISTSMFQDNLKQTQAKAGSSLLSRRKADKIPKLVLGADARQPELLTCISRRADEIDDDRSFEPLISKCDDVPLEPGRLPGGGAALASLCAGTTVSDAEDIPAAVLDSITFRADLHKETRTKPLYQTDERKIASIVASGQSIDAIESGADPLSIPHTEQGNYVSAGKAASDPVVVIPSLFVRESSIASLQLAPEIISPGMQAAGSYNAHPRQSTQPTQPILSLAECRRLGKMKKQEANAVGLNAISNSYSRNSAFVESNDSTSESRLKLSLMPAADTLIVPKIVVVSSSSTASVRSNSGIDQEEEKTSSNRFGKSENLGPATPSQDGHLSLSASTLTGGLTCGMDHTIIDVGEGADDEQQQPIRNPSNHSIPDKSTGSAHRPAGPDTITHQHLGLILAESHLNASIDVE